MRKLLIGSSALVVAIGIANIILFAVWWHTIEVTASMPKQTNYTLEALALNVTFLEIILVIGGLILAVLGIFGYNELKGAAIRSAVDAAEKEARQTASDQIKIYIDAMERSRSPNNPPEYSGDFALGDQPIQGATPAASDE